MISADRTTRHDRQTSKGQTTTHYQAITTRYLGPTNFRGARIKAQAAAGSVTVHYDHALNITDNHARAAAALAAKFDWKGSWYSGGLPDERGDVFVLADGSEPAFRI